MQMGSSGNVGGGATDKLYNTQFYNGNDSNRTITTGMDLTLSGGMVLLKSLDQGQGWGLFDTERGVTKLIQPNVISQEETQSNSLTGFTSTGFTLGSYGNFNNNGTHYIAYTFKKAEKFFDVVTYTGNGSNRTISHNLNCEPGMIWVKKLLGSDANYGNWQVYHKYGATSGGTTAAQSYAQLTNTGYFTSGSDRWNNTMPTTTEFSVGTNITVNQLNSTYVAYLFAHDPSASGQIKVGEWSTSASTVYKPNEFGWEADLCMVKTKQNADPWNVFDYDRGWSLKNSRMLRFSDSNPSQMRDESDIIFAPLEKGFYEGAGKGIAKYYSPSNYTNKTMIYMAIRKGDLDNVGDISGTLTSSDTGAKTVFYPSHGTTQIPAFSNAELTRTPDVDMAIVSDSVITSPHVYTMNRPVGSGALRMSSQSYALNYDANLRFSVKHVTTTPNAGDVGQGFGRGLSTDYRGYMWKRAKGFCDIVTYLGDTSATLADGNSVKTVSHKLNKVPSMIWVKSYLNLNSGASQLSWFVWSNQLTNNNYALILNANDAESTANGNLWNNTAPTSSAFTVCNVASGAVNLANVLYVAYVFGDVAGVSKVGKYTGAGGSTQVTVDCGFSSGVDFILIKRLDNNGEWYIFDRKNTGINVGNDGAYSWLSSTNTDITYNVTGGDMVEQTTAGFKVMGNSPATINVSGATYLFYAIAKTS